MQENEKEKRKLNRIIIMLVVFILFLFGLALILSGINIKTTKQEILFQYNEIGATDYNVFYVENSLYENNPIGKNNNYVTALIDRISIDLKYNLQSSKTLKYDYDYKVIANVYADYQEEGNIWNRQFTLIDTTNVSDIETVAINQNIDVDYNFYQNLVTEYKNTVGLNIDAYLSIKMYVNVNGLFDNKENIVSTDEIEVLIPMNKEVFNITENISDQSSNKVTESIKLSRIKNMYLLLSGILFASSAFIILLISLLKNIKIEKEETKYTSLLNKYLKEYSSIIIESEKIPDISKMSIIDVKNFYELIDAEEELRIPIVYAETKKRGEYESWFIIINNTQVFRYILSSKK